MDIFRQIGDAIEQIKTNEILQQLYGEWVARITDFLNFLGGLPQNSQNQAVNSEIFENHKESEISLETEEIIKSELKILKRRKPKARNYGKISKAITLRDTKGLTQRLILFSPTHLTKPKSSSKNCQNSLFQIWKNWLSLPLNQEENLKN